MFNRNTNKDKPFHPFKRYHKAGSGCGAVGRAVASYTRDPQFESSHWQYYSPVLRDENKRKRDWEWPYF